MLRLYDSLISGNAYKARLLLSQLHIDYERIELDLDAGETRTEEFHAKNPNGKIPLLELDDGSFLSESNAIQFYLAECTPFLPDDRIEKASYQALSIMENHLAAKRYFVADRYTIADIALYAYTHVAHEGGFDLDPYAAIRKWLDRVAGQPGHIPITQG